MLSPRALVWGNPLGSSSRPRIGSFYPPDVSDSTNLDELASSLARIPTNHLVILGSDFNLPDWDWSTGTPILKPGCKHPDQHTKLNDIIANHGLTQHITEPTRQDPHHGVSNTLDLIMTNRPSTVISSNVVPGISDHSGAVIELEVQLIRVTKKTRDIPLYKSAQWEDFASFIAEKCEDIRAAPLEVDVERLWNDLHDNIHEGTKKFIPHKRQKNKIALPYINGDLRRLIRKQDRLYDKMRKARRNVSTHARAASLRIKFHKLKLHVQTETRKAYWNYIATVILPQDGSGTPTKSFWSFVRRNRTEKMNISALKSPTTGDLVNSAVGKAEILNSQFRSVFTEETPLTDLHNTSDLHPDIVDIHFTEPGVRKLLERLDPSKACGPDMLQARVLKELATSIAPALTEIFNRSYRSGIVPSDWRHANVSPAFKKGKKILAANYHPISLTCICCKLFEHVMTRHIMDHAAQHNILYPLQHGFRSMLSCETQLVEFLHDLTSNCHAGHQTDVLVMDFSKAFDKVGHMRLLRKIASYGIRGRTLKWIEGFLANRTQVVIIDGERSRPVPVTSGVPQGSVLGPCLFLLYINDLAQDLDSTVRLFADDTIAYLTIDNQADAMCLQHDLDRLADWEKRWQMEFHPEKCQVLRVSKKTKASTICHDYILHGHTLEVVDNVKYLGVTISGNLKWDVHVSHITNKANSTLAVRKRNVRVSSQSLKTAAYKALVRPHVEYCSTVWDPSTAHLTRKVEMVQLRSARWVCNKYRTGLNTTGPTEMIRTLDWPFWVPPQSRPPLPTLQNEKQPCTHVLPNSPRALPIPHKSRAPPCSTTSRQNSQETILCHQFLPPHSLRLELTPPQCSHCSIHWGLQGLSDVSSGLEVQTWRF